MGTAETRDWWSEYRCATPSQTTAITMFGRSAGRVANPALFPMLALERALVFTGYEGVQSVWVNRNCPTGISGRECQPDGDWCSLHNYCIAVDIDPYGYGNPHFQKAFGNGWDFSDCKITRDQVAAVEGIENIHGEQMFRWLGWLIGDTMHFEIQVPPDRTGVNWTTVPEGANEMPQLPLTEGMDSEDVRSLQDRLNRAYGAGIAEDAKYGPATAAAVASSPMPSYTGDQSDAVRQGKRVNANMWNGLFEDWVKKIVGTPGAPVDAYTKSESDARFAKKAHPHSGTVIETTEVRIS